MEAKNIILELLISADRLNSERKFNDAFFQYEQIYPIITSLYIKNQRNDSIGNFAGWTAGFLTGGLGFEDLIIIPLISKGVSKYLGSDHEFIVDITSTVALRQINCVLSSESLLNNYDKNKVLQKFAILISFSENETIFKEIFNSFFPGLLENGGLSNNDVVYTPYYYLLDKVEKNEISSTEIFKLLHSYLVKINDSSKLRVLLDNIFTRYDEETAYSNYNFNYQEQSDNEDYYSILGVDINASKEEIKKAYIELMKKYHPDKFAHLSKEFQELANKKAQKINKAYEYLMNL
ncbi:MAG: J domain-containing protein [Ignavibacterium sp.]|nr:J domain-containing protein [Ignavibacterium sp.]MCX7611241.1 J domain-containing protein [Ignavibacterium sp.]MDW8376062.1 J domain-containing protein [Ignavibacteriales bacterium]